MISPAARHNMDIIRAWLDAHNRQDMQALDYMDDEVEIVETPTGVVWRGRQDIESLARLAYERRSYKELTHLFAADDEVCAEYTTRVSTADPVSEFAKEHGLHGIDITNAQPTVQTFALPVCFVCHISNGKIDRAREYWDAASMARQLGVTEGQPDEEVAAGMDGLTPKLTIEQRLRHIAAPAQLRNGTKRVD
jgi:ketosteroid isomerase-like protein